MFARRHSSVVVSDGHHVFGDLQHLGEQFFALLTVRNISSQVHNQVGGCGGVLQTLGWKRSPTSSRQNVF